MITILAAEAAEHAGSTADQYMELLSNPAHWAFEITLMLLFDVILLGMAWPLITRLVIKHDREHHPEDPVCNPRVDDLP